MPRKQEVYVQSKRCVCTSPCIFPNKKRKHKIHHYCTSRSMEPSTTNSNLIHHTRTTTVHEHEHEPEHEPLIVKISPRQEINGCEKRLKNEPSSQEKAMSMSQCKEEGSVVIPEKWGQENLLKEWIDYSTFDELLAPKEAGSAREALVAEARRREYIYHRRSPN